MKIVSVVLEAGNLSSLYEFYGGDLATPVLRRSSDTLSLQAGSTQLTFRRGEGNPFYHFAFNVHPDQFERLRAVFAAVTPLLHDADGEEVFDFRSWSARACYFYDPVGNIVEFIGRQDLSANQAPPPPGLMSVSEVGLTADDVPALTARITRELRLPVYRESAGDTFAALGDAEGLLILVQRGRIWYPDTGKAAAPAPVNCELEIDGARWQLQGPPYQFARVMGEVS